MERARKAATENSEGGFPPADEGEAEDVLGFFLAGGWEARYERTEASVKKRRGAAEVEVASAAEEERVVEERRGEVVGSR